LNDSLHFIISLGEPFKNMRDFFTLLNGVQEFVAHAVRFADTYPSAS